MNTSPNGSTYLVDPGTIMELRAQKVGFRNDFKATVSRFYDSDHLLDMAIKAMNLAHTAKGVFFTLDPLDPELLALKKPNHAENSPAEPPKTPTSSTQTKLLIDIDPMLGSARPPTETLTSDIRATNEEQARTQTSPPRASGATSRSPAGPGRSWSTRATSSFLLYIVDLPPDDGRLIKRCLKASSPPSAMTTRCISTNGYRFPAGSWRIPGTITPQGR